VPAAFAAGRTSLAAGNIPALGLTAIQSGPKTGLAATGSRSISMMLLASMAILLGGLLVLVSRRSPKHATN
jgi:LPXTG-motif cell wall-anchored protein